MGVIQIGDIVTLVIGVGSLAGLYYALKRSVDKLYNNFITMENSHNKDITMLNDALKETKLDIDRRETNLTNRINEIKEENKGAIQKLEDKLDIISNQVTSMNSHLSELTGYIKARKD